MKKISLLILTILLTAVFSFSQTSRGTVSGVVKDPNGAVIAGAEVTLTNTATTVSRSVVTNNEGFYRFEAVNLGTYSVRITAPSFGVITKNNITVNANQASVVDAELTIGSQEAVVDINADSGSQLQTEAPVRGGNISTRQIRDLPLSTGNPVSLAFTLPGVSTNRGGQGVASFSVNGARARSNNFLIDGTENNDISVAGQGFQITNQDAVQEVSVQTGNFDSEFGRAGGAVVNVITKSGTKDFHGTLAFEYDSSADDAITSSESRNPAVVSRGRPLSKTQFVPSATFGGPLFLPNFGEGGSMFKTRRDKNFFFVAYEETRFRQPGGSVTLIVPTAAGRATLQKYASSPNVATYLAATANAVATVANRPVISLDDSNLPANQQTRGNVEMGSYFRLFSNTQTNKQFQIRTDHSIGDKDQLSFRFLSDVQNSPLGGSQPGTAVFEGFDGDYSANYKNFLISETHIFSSKTTNELRLAYNLIDFGYPLSDPSGPAGTLPAISITGLTDLGTPATFPQGRTANNYQVQDTVTHIFGNHTLRGGIDYLRQISTQTAPANVRGSLAYGAGGGYTALGNFIDDFGGAGTASRVFGSPVYHPTLNRIATFIQDRWKATSKMNLTMGVRYEYFGTPFNRLRTPAFTGLFNVNPTTRTGPFLDPNQVKRDLNNFSPSVGLTYAPSYSSGILGFIFGEQRSVLRMGYNIGYDSFFNNIASNAVASSPNTIVTTNNSVLTAANPRGLANFSSQFPTSAATVLPNSSQTLIDPNLVNPYYQRWSAGLQRELPFNVVLDISYVGSKGTKLYTNEDANPLVRPELRSAVPSGYPNCNPGSTVTAAQATAQFPTGTACPLTGRLDNLQGPRTVRANSGTSIYHSGQLEVRRRFADHFQITGAYTFSKLISNADEVFGNTFATNTPNAAVPIVLGGLKDERAVSAFDRRHRASFTYVVESPFFRDQNGFLGKLFGGYQLSGVTTFESGVPFTIFNGFDSDGVGGGFDRPSYNPNGKKGVRAIALVNANNAITGYFNPELVIGSVTSTSPLAAIDPNTAEYIVNPAYVIGASGSVVRTGTLGRNTGRSNGLNNFDVTVLKRTRITETKFFEARAEFFNALNHPQYGTGIASNASTISNGLFLQPNTPATNGGGRTIRYQVKFIF